MSRALRIAILSSAARMAAPPAVSGTALAAVLLLSSAPAFAEGMPQLKFSNPLTVAQLFWGAVIFLLLYVILSRSALPRVGSVLEERRRRIDADLDAAKSARNEADRATIELRRARRDAAAEANAMVEKVVAEARADAAARTAEMNARLEAEVARAEATVAAARTAAMGSLRGIATETAATLVQRLTGQSTDGALVGAKVDAALAARPAIQSAA